MNKEKKNPKEKEKVESKKLTDEQMEQVSGGVQLIYSDDFSRIILVDDYGNEIKE